jgi:hypothetical protein
VERWNDIMAPSERSEGKNAVELAQYARDNRIIDEPAFAWWATGLLKKMNRFIKLFKSCHIRKGYKFGIRLPNNVEEAMMLDKENG